MPSSLPPATVYVIDDEECVRRAMERLLRSAGLKCRAFPCLDVFLAADFALERACVVSDIRMPGRSAFELPALLRAQHRTIPVIYVTAHDTTEYRDAARQVGATGYFRKPIDDQALLDAIEWALSSGIRQPRPEGTHEAQRDSS
jgi:FixJ family two-component response regulator